MLAKVCIVGPKGVGKSTLTSKCEKTALSKLLRGNSISNRNMVIGNKKIDLQIWDTCGEDRFMCMGPIFYKATNAAICMFDITCKQSFLDLQSWVISVQRNAHDECILVLLGNKRDLSEKREVTEKEATKYAEAIGATYFEISASLVEEVNEVFEHIGAALIRLHDCYSSYHAKLAITSSGMGVYTQRKFPKKRKTESLPSCLSCLIIR